MKKSFTIPTKDSTACRNWVASTYPGAVAHIGPKPGNRATVKIGGSTAGTTLKNVRFHAELHWR